MKKTTLLLLALAMLTLQSFSQCADSTNIYGFTYAGKYYEVVKEMKNWHNAAACAVERGGYLVEINDADEQNAIHDAIINGAEVSPTYTSVPNGGGIAYVWIGATDQHTEGVWLWDGNNDNAGTNFWTGQGSNGSGNGAPVADAYFNWGGTSTGTPKEPDNWGAGQHHAAIGLTGWPAGSTTLGIPGEWNDIIGSSTLYFVIEYDEGLGILDNSSEKNFRVFPNPTYGEINISGREAISSIHVANILGEIVYSNSTHGLSGVIDLGSFKQGVYFVKIDSGSKHFIQKVLLL
jgi:hypothetical protein